MYRCGSVSAAETRCRDPGHVTKCDRRSLPVSVLAQRFADPALDELVLAHDALGVDPQLNGHAVPSPLRHLGGVDAAIQPRRQAGMPKVI
jgi:hypothetical protein